MASFGFNNGAAGSLAANGNPESLQVMFAKLSNTPGGSTDSKHLKEIDVLGIRYGVTQSNSAHLGGGSGVGKAQFESLAIMKNVDVSTPNLMKHCASGKHLPELVISICKVGGEGLAEYMKITLKEVFITGVNVISDTSSPRVMEEVSFAYGVMSVEVKSQNADGSLGAAVTGAWDVKQNKAA